MAKIVTAVISMSAETVSTLQAQSAVTLIGEDFRADSQRAARHQQRETGKHEFRASQNAHTPKGRKYSLAHGEDHRCNNPTVKA